MDSTFYQFQLGSLAVICTILLAFERYLKSKKSTTVNVKELSVEENLEVGQPNGAAVTPRAGALGALMRKYILVYAIVMGADWLQGPYVYSLYREQYAFPERQVAVLFVTGFISAAIFAPLVGVWADTYGRKRICLLFCVLYAMTCGLLLFPFFPLLLLARVFGGISTSILFSAFESWLVSSSSDAALHSEDLSTIMGRATLVNGFVATAAGIVSNQLVEWNNGGFRSPFVASGCLLLLAWVVISGSWSENYGGGAGAGVAQVSADVFQIRRLGAAWRIVAADPILLVLGLTQTIFEGSMYLFVFIWVPTLQESSLYPSSLPLGYIFSAFMVSMMLGSLIYTFVTAHWFRPIPTSALQKHTRSSSVSSLTPQGNPTLTLHAQLSALVCAASAVTFAACVSVGRGKSEQSEHLKFWAFCLFEACVGMYYPVQGMLRGSLIANEHRATLSALFRVPLNVFVVVSLLTGVSSARDAVLTTCAVVLAISSLTTAFIVIPRVDNITQSRTYD
jgi:MFS family permease